MIRKIASHYALVNGELLRDIVVEVDASRQIIAIEQVTSLDNRHGVEFYPGILIPGMVNAHCHLELSYLRGAIAEGGGFATFAREIGRVRGNYTLEERISAAVYRRKPAKIPFRYRENIVPREQGQPRPR